MNAILASRRWSMCLVAQEIDLRVLCSKTDWCVCVSPRDQEMCNVFPGINDCRVLMESNQDLERNESNQRVCTPQALSASSVFQKTYLYVRWLKRLNDVSVFFWCARRSLKVFGGGISQCFILVYKCIWDQRYSTCFSTPIYSASNSSGHCLLRCCAFCAADSCRQ